MTTAFNTFHISTTSFSWASLSLLERHLAEAVGISIPAQLNYLYRLLLHALYIIQSCLRDASWCYISPELVYLTYQFKFSKNDIFNEGRGSSDAQLVTQRCSVNAKHYKYSWSVRTPLSTIPVMLHDIPWKLPKYHQVICFVVSGIYCYNLQFTVCCRNNLTTHTNTLQNLLSCTCIALYLFSFFFMTDWDVKKLHLVFEINIMIIII